MIDEDIVENEYSEAKRLLKKITFNDLDEYLNETFWIKGEKIESGQLYSNNEQCVLIPSEETVSEWKKDCNEYLYLISSTNDNLYPLTIYKQENQAFISKMCIIGEVAMSMGIKSIELIRKISEHVNSKLKCKY